MSQEIVEGIARVETKVDIILENQADHETRLRSLERVKHWAIGAAAAVSGTISLLFKTKN